MTNRSCECMFLTIISIVLGVIVGYLFYSGLITGIVTGLWIVLGITGFVLLISFLSILFIEREYIRCFCKNGQCLLLGIFGSLILTTIALSITLTIASIFSAVLIGLIAVFALLMIMTFAWLINCTINIKCGCKK